MQQESVNNSAEEAEPGQPVERSLGVMSLFDVQDCPSQRFLALRGQALVLETIGFGRRIVPIVAVRSRPLGIELSRGATRRPGARACAGIAGPNEFEDSSRLCHPDCENRVRRGLRQTRCELALLVESPHNTQPVAC